MVSDCLSTEVGEARVELNESANLYGVFWRVMKIIFIISGNAFTGPVECNKTYS